MEALWNTRVNSISDGERHWLKTIIGVEEDPRVLIIDDYGHFKGARKAVDEYFSQLSHNYFMHRIDYSARIIIKN